MNVRKVLISSLFGFNALALNAQETDVVKNDLSNSVKERKNELGIFGQAFNGADQFRGQALMGIQFKYWIKPNVAFRILAAYNPYNYSARPFVLEEHSADSFRVQYSSNTVDMVALGFGLEAQRQFYKRVFLFAGLELLAGYGEGKTTTFSRIVPVENMYNSFGGNGNPDYQETFFRKSYARLIPGIGAKIVFNKINFGLETQFASIGVDAERNGTRSSALPSIDVFNNMAYRLHVNYQF